MTKNWWFKFNFRVWRTDPELRECSLETRGFWLECLCVMQERETYEITGTYERLSRLLGCSASEIARCATELKETKTADVTLGNGIVTLLSRRLKRELSVKEQTRLRVQKSRRNADVTVQSKSKSNKKEKEEEKREVAEAAPSRKKGIRLPDPFLLTSKMREYGQTKKPDVDLTLETEKFCNYFRAVPGQKGVKLDWEATWRNWILNSNGNWNASLTPKVKQLPSGLEMIAQVEADRHLGLKQIPIATN